MTDSDSILVADCGSTRTTATLIERVNGHHRLVARGEAISTHRPPWLDATLGVREAVGQIEALLGRRLLSEAGTLLRRQSRAGDPCCRAGQEKERAQHPRPVSGTGRDGVQDRRGCQG